MQQELKEKGKFARSIVYVVLLAVFILGSFSISIYLTSNALLEIQSMVISQAKTVSIALLFMILITTAFFVGTTAMLRNYRRALKGNHERKKVEQTLRESEIRYRAIFENTGTAMVILEDDTTISLCNEKFEKLACSRKSDIVGKSWTTFAAKDDLERMLSQHKLRRTSPESAQRAYEFRFVDKLGTSTPVLLFINLIPETKTSIASIISISDQRQAEKEREQLQVQLFHASKLASIGTLAAGVAHEINNPLAVAAGFQDILKMHLKDLQVSDAKVINIFSKQERAFHRIENIVNGLRTYARSDTEILQPIDLHDVIKDTLTLIQSIFEKSSIIFEVFLDADKSSTIANIGKFQQVLMNLFTNAKDAFEESGKEGIIRIETKNESDRVVVKISDNGPGIDEKHLGTIFDPFFTTKAPGKGTGLGLSIVHSMIDQFKGQIRVDSTKGVHTTFTISLPCVEPSKHVTAPKAHAKLAGRALIVDDEPDIRLAIVNYLGDSGLDFCEASDGVEALDILKKEPFDFLITDLKMPRMNGDVLIVEVAKIRPDTKVIVITGGIVTEYSKEQRDIIRQYADAYLKKPLKAATLREALDLAVENKKKRSGSKTPT